MSTTNPFNHIIIFYFSGTGNAKKIAAWFSEFAAKRNIQSQIYDIAKTAPDAMENMPDDALIMIVSPIHGFNFPKITLDFIRHFPKGKNRIVLMNTRAGMLIRRFVTPGLTGVAFLFSSWILKWKGYRIVGQIPFDMPSNWLSLHPALNEKTVKYLHQVNYHRVEKHSEIIFSGKPDFFAYRELLQDILISPVSLAYYLAGRFAFAKSFYASNDCNHCGLCAKQCPVQAIKMINKRPYWTFHCESCMRCMNSCPKRAIETGLGFLIIVGIISSILLSILFNNLLKIHIESEIVEFILFTLLFIIISWLFYKFQHLLLRNPWMGKLISYTALTHYSFWGRYLTISDDQWKNK